MLTGTNLSLIQTTTIASSREGLPVLRLTGKSYQEDIQVSPRNGYSFPLYFKSQDLRWSDLNHARSLQFCACARHRRAFFRVWALYIRGDVLI